jgi:hypothetical protein
MSEKPFLDDGSMRQNRLAVVPSKGQTISLINGDLDIEQAWAEAKKLKEKLAAILEGKHEDEVGFAIRYLLYDFLIATRANKEERQTFFAFVDAVVSVSIEQNPDPSEKRWACS